MSVRSNGSGDRLSFDGHALSIGTGAVSFGVAVKLMSDRNAFSDIIALGTTPTAGFPAIATASDGTGVVYYLSGTNSSTVQGLVVGDWMWVVGSRNAGTTGKVRLWNKYLQKIGEATVADTANYANDALTIGEQVAGEWIDAEFRNAKLHVGVEWTDAQAVSEARRLGIQTPGGAGRHCWNLKTTNADATGLNELFGLNPDLTNTGCVLGASEPDFLNETTEIVANWVALQHQYVLP